MSWHHSYRQSGDPKTEILAIHLRDIQLSAHIYASSPRHGYAISWYDDELLHLAYDLGKRLLPAFHHSLTGLPWARVNLRHGLSRVENMETCSAAAGSLLLEFATLSRLTGDPTFEVSDVFAWGRRAREKGLVSLGLRADAQAVAIPSNSHGRLSSLCGTVGLRFRYWATRSTL